MVEVATLDSPAVQEWPTSDAAPLYRPVGSEGSEAVEAGDPDPYEEPARTWRATGDHPRPPAPVVGRMVHRASQRWLFPGDAGLDVLLHSIAIDEGLVGEKQRRRAVQEAISLLQRLRDSELWREIDAAAERHHEVPFPRRRPDGRPDTGVIDLLYRTDAGWHVVDFKTDKLKDRLALRRAVEEHTPQITRYRHTAREIVASEVDIQLCFLDYRESVRSIGV